MIIKTLLVLEKNTGNKWVTHKYSILITDGSHRAIISDNTAKELKDKGVAEIIIDTRNGKMEGRAEHFNDLPIYAKK